MKIKKILAAVLACAMVCTAIGIPVFAAEEMTYTEFLTIMEENGYSYDFNGATITLTTNFGCSNNLHDVESCPKGYPAATAETPVRFDVNMRRAQYQPFKAYEGDITIKNANFVADISNGAGLCANTGYANSFEAGTQFYPELQFENLGNLTIEGCSFNNICVAPYHEGKSTSAEVTDTIRGCRFSNLYNAYGIASINGGSVLVENNTFENCNGGIYIQDGGSEGITIVGNQFSEMGGNCLEGKEDSRGLIQLSSAVNPSENASVSIINNTSDGSTPVLRQLSDNVETILTAGNDFAGSEMYTADTDSANNVSEASPVAKIDNVYYASLGEAVAAAEPEDVILIQAGEYDLNTAAEIPGIVSGGVLYLNSGITLRGEDGVVLKGSIRIQSGDVTIENIKFTEPVVLPAGDDEPICIDINTGSHSNITIRDCVFETEPFQRVQGKRYKGIVTSSSGTYNKLVIEGNEFTNLETAVHVNPGATEVSLTDNTVVTGCDVFAKLEGTAGAQISGNTVNGADIYVRPNWVNGNAPGSGIEIAENIFDGAYVIMDKEQPAVSDKIELGRNYWNIDSPSVDDVVADGDTELVNFDSYYTAVDGEGKPTGLVTIPDDLADVTKTVTFEQVMDGETATNQINIYLEGSQEGKEAQIENLIAADLTFVIEGQFAVTGFTPADADWTYQVEEGNRYLISSKGVNDEPIKELEGQKILLGTLTLGGYGEGSINLSAAAENRVEQRSKDGQNLDISTEVAANTDATAFEITRAQAELTIDLDFSHEIAEGNTADYNDFTVTVTGSDGQTQSYRIGTGGTAYSADGAEIKVSLNKGERYTVEVKGAGYRTFRQSVTMDGNKTMTVWNNAKDTEGAVVDDVKAETTFLAGDILMDNEINLYDLSAVVSYFGQTGLKDAADYEEYRAYDLNRDGKIDSRDVAMVLVSWGR